MHFQRCPNSSLVKPQRKVCMKYQLVYIRAVLFAFQYHNKVTCFMLQQIEECCSLGAHAAVIIPPTWIIRVRRTQVHTHPHLLMLSLAPNPSLTKS